MLLLSIILFSLLNNFCNKYITILSTLIIIKYIDFYLINKYYTKIYNLLHYNFLYLISPIVFVFIKYYLRLIKYFDYLTIKQKNNLYHINSNEMDFYISPIINTQRNIINYKMFVDNIEYPLHIIINKKEKYIYGIPYSPHSLNSKTIIIHAIKLCGNIEEKIFNGKEKIII